MLAWLPHIRRRHRYILDTLFAPPLTLCHGDAHIQNTYVRSDGTVGMFDFQLTLRACWARDVSYIIGTSLPVELRRRHEDALGGIFSIFKACGVIAAGLH